jgi:hypothetical protein
VYFWTLLESPPPIDRMSDFDDLPVWLQRQVDAAFDKACTLLPDPVFTGLVPAAAKKSWPGHDEGELTNYHSDDEQFPSEGGGFLVGDKPGGYLSAEGNTADSSECRPDSLGLSMIPAAVSHRHRNLFSSTQIFVSIKAPIP